jgi:hypothetical protein
VKKVNKDVFELMKLKKQLIDIADQTKDMDTFCELDEIICQLHNHLNKSILCVVKVGEFHVS